MIIKLVRNFFGKLLERNNVSRIRRCYSHMEQVKRNEKFQQWAPVIGLEIHAQIASKSKLFSGAPNIFMAPPNSVVSNFDASMPGTLPVLNYSCVEKALITALALDCHINHRSYFDRKHYFYADMPQGYQITQQRCPIAVRGYLYFPTLDGAERKRVNILQLQLEQDSGKSLHDNEFSFIDLNRAGVGLMEIVTGPDFHSADDSLAFVQELYLLLKRLGTCEGKLSEGQFRVDVNISLNIPGEKLGTRAEVKNICGFQTIHQVIEYEILRQRDILNSGGRVEQETRGFNVDKGTTVPMRDKEVTQDYRFMPEPNLPPLQVYNDETIGSAAYPEQAINVDDLKRSLPSLPSYIREKLMQKLQLNFQQAMLVVEREADDFFLEVMAEDESLPPLQVFEWIRIVYAGYLNDHNLDSIYECPITADQLAHLLQLENSLQINHSTATEAFHEAIKQGKSPVQIIEENNCKMISDVKFVTELCEDAIEFLDKSNAFANYKAGDPNGKKNKKIIKKVTDLVRNRTDNKVHTRVAKNVIVKLLDSKK